VIFQLNKISTNAFCNEFDCFIAGTCVTSDSQVVRDMFYDGRPKMEQCTIVSRIAQTFLR